MSSNLFLLIGLISNLIALYLTGKDWIKEGKIIDCLGFWYNYGWLHAYMYVYFNFIN